MRKFYSFLLCFVVTLSFAATKDHFKVESDRNSEINLNFKTPIINQEKISINGQDFSRFINEDAVPSIVFGEPELPLFSTFVEVGETGSYELEYTVSGKKTVKDVVVYPSQEKLRDISDEVNFYINNDIYNAKSFKNDIVKISKPMIMRNKRLVQLTISPLSYLPSLNKVEIAKSISIKLTQKNIASENEILRSDVNNTVFSSIYESSIVNYSQDREIAFHPKNILIIYNESSNDGYNEKLDDYVNWKREKGANVTLASTNITGSTGNSIKAYIQNAYETWDNAPEYIVLMGDAHGSFEIPTFQESTSSYGGEGDYPYVLLAGDDNLPDAFVGRITFETVTQFKTIINKLIKYESLSQTYDYQWMDDVLLAAATDHGTGISAWITNRYVRELIDSYKPNYYNFEVMEEVATSPSAVSAAINAGKLIYNYRGWLGMDGWDNSYISSLSNDDMPVNAVIATCSTGPFASSYTEAKTEALLRAGTVATPKGAISAIGMSTSGTHTTFNNCLVGGIFHGLFVDDLTTMGEALARGQIYLFETYGVSNPTQAYTFAHWGNLMGDPSLDVWKQIPEQMTVSHDASVNVGSNFIEVTASVNGANVENALVTVYDVESSYQKSILTDENGHAVVSLDNMLSGDFKLTVTKQDHIPYQAEVLIQGNENIVYQSVQLSDDNIANAGDTIDLSTIITNNTGVAFTDATGILSTTDNYITINESSSDFANTGNGAISQNSTPFNITIAGNTPDGYIAHLKLELENDSNSWACDVPIEILSPLTFVSEAVVTSPSGDFVNIGDTGSITFTVKNEGHQVFNNTELIVRSLDNRLVITDSIATLGNIGIGETVTAADAINIEVSAIAVPGLRIPMQMIVTNDQGIENLSTYTLTIGNPTISDPTGPDEYGYICYDDSDSSTDAPTYEWIEISTDGTIVPLSDNGNNQDDSEVVDLPFTFMYYGEIYDQITVSSNGWISMGVSTQATFRNWRIPGPLGPNAIIAPFWDDLTVANGGAVYSYFDQTLNAFIVQWDQCPNYYNSGTLETFQVILYNPVSMPTSTGDGVIKFQYKNISNIDQGNSSTHGNYATVGIEDHTQTRGLEYTFNNQYPVTAKTLENEMALVFMPAPQIQENANLMLGNVYIHNSMSNTVVYPGEEVDLGITLMNFGSVEATNVTASLQASDIYSSVISASADYPNIDGVSSATNFEHFTVQVSDLAQPNSLLSFTLNINSDGGTWTRNLSIPVGNLDFGYVNYGTYEETGNGNGTIDPGETGKVIVYVSNPFVEEVEIAASLSSTNTNLTISESNYTDFMIPKTTIMQFVFDVSLSISADSTPINLLFTINSDSVNDLSEEIVFTPSFSAINYDFEEDNGGFTANNVWAHGLVSSAHSGANAWETVLGGNYPDDANASLVTEPFMVGDETVLTYWQSYNFENSFDGGVLEVSTDNNTYNVIVPEGDYNDDSINSLGTPGFTGDHQSWTQISVDLSSYSGEEIYFRWRMGSDGSVSRTGWKIDDVEITGVSSVLNKVYGNVTTNGSDISNPIYFTEVESNVTTKVSDSNLFEFYVEEGSYQFSITSEDYSTYTTDEVSILDNDLAMPQVILEYLSPVNALEVNNSNGNITVNWDYSNSNPATTFANFNVYRKSGTAAFVKVATTSSDYYSEQLESGVYQYYVTASYTNGESSSSEIVDLVIDVVSANEEVNYVEEIVGNYPNPFNPTTNIKFSIPKNDVVKISIYNIKGQLVKTLANKQFDAGVNEIQWHGNDNSNNTVSTGVYFIRMQSSRASSTKKVLLLK